MSSNSNMQVGRRKTATARALLTGGEGKITVNGKTALEYFKSEAYMIDLSLPMKVTNTSGSFDVKVNVNGGGIAGQVGAVRLAIARALVRDNEEHRIPLRANDLLTRDPRMVERKKYGQPKARKRFQFSKR